MNEKIKEIIQQLANQLGTTTEYLWNVLLKQAPIDATIGIILIIIVLIFGYLLFKLHKKLIEKPKNDNYNYSYYEKYELGATFPMVFLAIIWVSCLIISMLNIHSIITGFLNPEYWALQKIMSLL
jgi:H+/gluconate symporter-like permease